MPDPKLQLSGCPNLASLWLAVLALRGEIQAAGLRRMNAELGTKTRSGRINDWSAGRRSPDPRSARWMLRDALPPVLAEIGLRPRQVARWTPVLADALAPPIPTEGGAP